MLSTRLCIRPRTDSSRPNLRRNRNRGSHRRRICIRRRIWRIRVHHIRGIHHRIHGIHHRIRNA
jgi:hypothetical protein